MLQRFKFARLLSSLVNARVTSNLSEDMLVSVSMAWACEGTSQQDLVKNMTGILILLNFSKDKKICKKKKRGSSFSFDF